MKGPLNVKDSNWMRTGLFRMIIPILWIVVSSLSAANAQIPNSGPGSSLAASRSTLGTNRAVPLPNKLPDYPTSPGDVPQTGFTSSPSDAFVNRLYGAAEGVCRRNIVRNMTVSLSFRTQWRAGQDGGSNL
jgi:hypothetical protein